jgi:hypothetical protein
LDEHEAAEMLGVSASTLRRNRAEKLPSDFILIRGAVRYALEDLQRFVERAKRGR